MWRKRNKKGPAPFLLEILPFSTFFCIDEEHVAIKWSNGSKKVASSYSISCNLLFFAFPHSHKRMEYRDISSKVLFPLVIWFPSLHPCKYEERDKSWKWEERKFYNWFIFLIFDLVLNCFHTVRLLRVWLEFAYCWKMKTKNTIAKIF